MAIIIVLGRTTKTILVLPLPYSALCSCDSRWFNDGRFGSGPVSFRLISAFSLGNRQWRGVIFALRSKWLHNEATVLGAVVARRHPLPGVILCFYITLIGPGPQLFLKPAAKNRCSLSALSPINQLIFYMLPFAAHVSPFSKESDKELRRSASHFVLERPSRSSPSCCLRTLTNDDE